MIKKNQVLFVILVYFMQGIIHNLGHPVTPALVSGLSIPDYYFGIYFAAMSFGLLVGAPLWGILADMVGKKYFIFFGLLLYSIGQLLFGYSTNENLMIVYRFMSGFGVSASITLLVSHLVECSDESNRKRYLAWYQGGFLLGSSVGYYIAGRLTESAFFINVLNTNDYRVIFLIQAIWNIFHAVIILLMLREKSIIKTSERKSFISNIKNITKLNIELFIFLISLTFFSLGTIVVSKFIEVYMNDVGLAPKDIGDFVGVTGVVSLITMIIIVPFIEKINKDFYVMILIQLLSASIIFVVFRQSDIIVWLYSGFLLYIVLKTLYSPLEQHFIASFCGEKTYSSVLGVRQAFYSIGLVLGPLIAGVLYDVKPLYAFDFAVVMFLIGFGLLIIVGRRLKNQNDVGNKASL